LENGQADTPAARSLVVKVCRKSGRLNDRPRGIVQDHDVGPTRFELFPWDHEDIAIELRPAFSYYETNTGQPIAQAVARYLAG